MRLTCTVALLLAAGFVRAADVKVIGPQPAAGSARAVVVDPAPLAHTAQVFAQDPEGRLVGKKDPAAQVAKVLENLDDALKAGKSALGRAVKINVYAADAGVIAEVNKALARRFPGDVKPAVSYVVGQLAVPDAVVGMDAVGVSDLKTEPGGVRHFYSPGVYRKVPGAHAAVLPAGPVVYVAGQAEKGKDLAEMTRKTLESLSATLKFLELTDGHVVQLKSFVHPMDDIAAVRKAFADYFGDRQVPPLVFVEWTYQNSIEIELIAAAPEPREKLASTVDFFTPPFMTASPIYSRVARVNHGKRIYVGGLYGKGDSGAEQVKDIFAQLDDVLRKAGSDFKHMAKATYYVSTDDASTQLNKLRPDYYDPKRPPAASKAGVRGTGREGRGITIDMIAVTTP